jgi:purine nucleosidase
VTEPAPSARRIILDTDLGMGQPGSDIDDGFALALALGESDLSVELVTTVNGNTHVDNATRLTVELLQRIGREVPVLRGADRPLVRSSPASPHDAPRFEPPTADGVEPVPAAVALVERVMREPGELTVVAIGPLTNLALALALEPRVATSVREIVVMGGVFLEQTNVAAMPGEYNFWCDPDAAQAVMECGAPLRLVGLDVTRRVRLTRADADALAGGGDFGRLAAAAAHGWMDFQERVKPREEIEQDSCALHDPLAVAVVTRPDLVTWREAHVAVETDGRFTRGVAVADLLMWENPPTPNCRIATEVDAEAFRAVFVERMAGLP